MKGKKLLALIMALAMAVLTLAGCGDKPAPANMDALSVCIASEPQTIDPALNSAVDGAILTQHVFEGLMRWGDAEKPVENATVNYAKLVTGQAEKYEKTVNEDGTVTYVFTLRDGIKWSDGKPVVAGDFEYAWKRAVNPETASDYSNMFSAIVGFEEANADAANTDKLAVKAVDEKTLEVTLSTDLPYFLELCAFPTYLPVRKDIIESAGDQWTFSPDTYIGNGMYKMAEWSHNQKIVLTKNEEYYGKDNVAVKDLTFILSDDDNAMLAAYRSGEVNFIQSVPVDETPALLADGTMKILPYLGTYYVCYQNQKAPFNDARVRKAFTLAIDSKFITEKITQTGEVPANGWVPNGIADADPAGADFRTTGGAFWEAPTSEEIYKKNLEEANRLLDEAGYTDRSTFPVVEYLYNTNERHRAIGEALQQMWQEGLGVRVTLNNQDWSVFLQTRKDGDYMIARNGWINDYNDPMGFLDMWTTGGGNNDAKYSNPAYDAAIKKAMSTSDPAERMAAMHEAENLIIGQDWALGPIYFYTQNYLMDDAIKGVYYTPLGFFFFHSATK